MSAAIARYATSWFRRWSRLFNIIFNFLRYGRKRRLELLHGKCGYMPPMNRNDLD